MLKKKIIIVMAIWINGLNLLYDTRPLDMNCYIASSNFDCIYVYSGTYPGIFPSGRGIVGLEGAK